MSHFNVTQAKYGLKRQSHSIHVNVLAGRTCEYTFRRVYPLTNKSCVLSIQLRYWITQNKYKQFFLSALHNNHSLSLVLVIEPNWIWLSLSPSFSYKYANLIGFYGNKVFSENMSFFTHSADGVSGIE